MLTKMRRRFIASAMAAMGAVTLVLLVAINLWNYNITTNRLDDTINSLITTGKNPYSGSSNFTLPDIFSDNSPESKYMTRYFAVVYDSDGDAVRVFSDYIATVSAQEALYYASDALSSGLLRRLSLLPQKRLVRRGGHILKRLARAAVDENAF